MRPKQAREAFRFLDRDDSGRLTLREVNEAVAAVFQRAPSPGLPEGALQSELPCFWSAQSPANRACWAACRCLERGGRRCLSRRLITAGTMCNACMCRFRAARTPRPRAEARQGARRERANLRVQLQDTRATVGTLRRIMAVILQAVNCFFWLAIYNARARPRLPPFPAAARPPRGRALSTAAAVAPAASCSVNSRTLQLCRAALLLDLPGVAAAASCNPAALRPCARPQILCAGQVDLRSTWTVVSSVILAFAFAFQNSVRHLFESVIFLFFTHPCAGPPPGCVTLPYANTLSCFGSARHSVSCSFSCAGPMRPHAPPCAGPRSRRPAALGPPAAETRTCADGLHAACA